VEYAVPSTLSARATGEALARLRGEIRAIKEKFQLAEKMWREVR